MDGHINRIYIKVGQFHRKSYHIALKDLSLELLYDIQTDIQRHIGYKTIENNYMFDKG